VRVEAELNAERIHVPLAVLRGMSAQEKSRFRAIGASCHSVEDAREAENNGCTYITAGHIFETNSKKGLPPRGLDFLKNVCRSVDIPVCAIGGIGADNLAAVRAAGASGACVMGDFMRCEDVPRFFARLRRAAQE
jgi:thiamine-phosphate pyrophosphorylase